MISSVLLGMMVQKAHKGLRATLVLRVPKVPKVNRGRRESRGFKACRARLGLMVLRVQQERTVPKGMPALRLSAFSPSSLMGLG